LETNRLTFFGARGVTKQEYYDLLCKSAVDGTFPSFISYGPEGKIKTCTYRGPGNKKCAAGLLIPDEKYYPELEKRMCTDKEVQNVIVLPEKMTIDDVKKCQEAHDRLLLYDIQLDSINFIQSINKLACFVNVIKQKV
jgi:hypothetical protein